MSIYSYNIEDLFNHQDKDYCEELIAPLISWLDPSGTAVQPITIKISDGNWKESDELKISWNTGTLIPLSSYIEDQIRKYRTGKTVNKEHHVELAAYGLAMIAASCIINKRIIDLLNKVAPDFIYERINGKIKGIEVAGRSSGGYPALRVVALGPKRGKKGKCFHKHSPSKGTIKRKSKKGKIHSLKKNDGISEAYLSLWSALPWVSYLNKVKP
jgi:hypothetical protein